MVVSGHSQQGDKSFSLSDFYQQLSPLFFKQYGTECRQIGYALFCEPCPEHPQEKNDAMILDILSPVKGMLFSCTKETAYSDKYAVFNETEISVIQELKKVVRPKEIDTTRSEIVERSYVLNNIIISMRETSQEGFRVFRYSDEGIYKEIGPGAVKAELQALYEKLWGVKPSLNIVTQMKNKVCLLTLREGGESIFSAIKGEYHYLVGKRKDIEVNRITGEVRFLDKDPENRPFTRRLPYDFSEEAPEGMPKELEFLRKYTSPKFFNNILVMLASGLSFQSDAQIFILFSRGHGTGKSTFSNILESLFGKDLVTRVQPKQFFDQFVESKLLGKSLMILEEYRGGSQSIDETLKRLASRDSTISANRKHKEYVDAENTVTIITSANELRYGTDDEAFLWRLRITPFVHIWKEQEYPRWLKDQSAKERIILYIAKNVLPAYLRGELKPSSYPLARIKEWLENADEPKDWIDRFLRENFYRNCAPQNKEAILVSMESAFQYYLLWADRNDILPASDSEFMERLNRIEDNEGLALVTEKEGKQYICMKKANLEFFM